MAILKASRIANISAEKMDVNVGRWNLKVSDLVMMAAPTPSEVLDASVKRTESCLCLDSVSRNSRLADVLVGNLFLGNLVREKSQGGSFWHHGGALLKVDGVVVERCSDVASCFRVKDTGRGVLG